MKLISLKQMKHHARYSALVALLCLTTTSVFCEVITINLFAGDGLSGWEPQVFKGNTIYSVGNQSGRKVIKAYSKHSASGLVKKVNLDPQHHRYLKWSWKIMHTIPEGNEMEKSGDDYAARVYVVFPGRFFWQTRAINYIWANHLPAGTFVPNAYSRNVMMFAVESGIGNAGKWVQEQRDVVADYRAAFGEEPKKIGAIAIMTDTDNTGTEATAWYSDLTISTSPLN